MYLMNILKSASSKVFCHTEEIQESFLNMPSEEAAKMKHMASESFEKYDMKNCAKNYLETYRKYQKQKIV